MFAWVVVEANPILSRFKAQRYKINRLTKSEVTGRMTGVYLNAAECALDHISHYKITDEEG